MKIAEQTDNSENDITLNSIEKAMEAGNGATPDHTRWLVERHHELVDQVARLQMAVGDEVLALAGTGELAAAISADTKLADEIRVIINAPA